MMERIEFVYIEDVPWRHGVVGERYLSGEYTTLASAYHDALDHIYRHPDAIRCVHCSESVGFVLHLRNDDLGPGEVTRWHPLTLARMMGESAPLTPVSPLCESCTPPDLSDLQKGFE